MQSSGGKSGTFQQQGNKLVKGLSEDEEGPEAILRKLSQTFGVLSYVILNRTGIPVKYQGIEAAEAIHYAGLISELTRATREFIDKKLFQPQTQDNQELVTIRLRTKKHEIVITPEENFTLIVVHNPNYTEPPPVKPEEAAQQQKTEREG